MVEEIVDSLGDLEEPKTEEVEEPVIEKTVEERLKEVEEENRQLKLKQQLKENGLSDGLATYLKDGVDITELTNILKKNMLDNSYKANTQKKETVSITKTDFKKMGYVERLNLFNTQPELFNKLNS